MAATLMTTPSRGAFGRMNCVGTTISRALAGQPRIDARVGAHDLFVADVEAARDVGERVFLGGLRLLHHADDVLVGSELEAMRGDRLRQCRL